jgi:hypothetical protein
MASSEAWFWHTTRWLEYTLSYNPSLESRSLAFLVCDGSTPVAVVPLVMERHRRGNVVSSEFSFGGGWLPAPACIDGLSSRQEKEAHRFIFDRVLFLGEEQGISRISFRSSPFAILGSSPESVIPVAVRFGFSSCLLPTQVIDVRNNPEELLKAMRKGHRSDIKRAGKHLKGIVCSRENTARDLFLSYRGLHEKAAGRQTRPGETFDMMYKWIEDGYAALFGALLDGRPVSFAYVMLYKQCAYYGSACNDPEIGDLPLAHFIQWEILKWLHEAGFRYYEIGWQFYVATPVFPASAKEIAVSSFKRGFGGNAVPMVLSERFLSRSDFLYVSQDRIERFAETLLEVSYPKSHCCEGT